MKATNCLFFTTLYKETRGTFVPLYVAFFLQNLQCLEGWNSAFEEDMPWKPAIEHERKQAIANMQSVHVATRELRYFLAREIGERPAN